jgi:hypothetical protein
MLLQGHELALLALLVIPAQQLNSRHVLCVCDLCALRSGERIPEVDDATLAKDALSVRPRLSEIFFSFCGERPASIIHTWHCRVCGECKDWRNWHCETCNRCQYGASIPCEMCKPDLYEERMHCY